MEFAKLKEIISDVLHFKADQITEDADLVRDLGADSLDLFEIYVEIGKVFEVEVSEEDEGRIVTVGDILDVIRHTKSGI